jgi:RuvB-like protein 1 (pontin 52)
MSAPSAQPDTIITQPPPPTATRESRIATHSHIKGLGLADDGTAMESSQGFVGQRSAREALGLHLALLKQGRHSGRPLLLVGPPGTGKVSEVGVGGAESWMLDLAGGILLLTL